jgi:hypothetical protein
MFLQSSPPDTSGYMILGYTVAFVVMALYAASLYIRKRNLHRDLEMLEEMDRLEATKATPAKPKKKNTVEPAQNKRRK